MSGSTAAGPGGTPTAPPAPDAAPPSPWNIANALTVLRILLVPVYGWLLLVDGGASTSMRWAAVAVFVVAMATDRLDGDIARSRGLITDFGKVADPIADKALTGMAFVGLSLVGVVWWWVTILVLAREVLITAVRFVVIRYAVMPASRGGKIKTTLQAVALGMLTAPLGGAWWWVAMVVLAGAVVVTVVTGAEYLTQAWGIRRLARGGGEA